MAIDAKIKASGNVTVSEDVDKPNITSSSKQDRSRRGKTFNFLLYITTFGVIFLLMIYYFPASVSDKVCYSRVGCFLVSGSWSARGSVFNFFPQSPTLINTTFIVASRSEPTGRLVHATSPNSIVWNLTHFPWGKHNVVVFIIHGFTDDTTTWMQTLKEAYLNLADVTVILVDWRSGASGYYPQVVANTRVVAREISIFIQYSRIYWTSAKLVHLVGHSLGSHISSYVGKVAGRQKIEQILALDPAFPLFEGFSPDIRLHHQDAQHVLVIHSNIGPWGLGMKYPTGTVDIYLNNGRDQRGCMSLDSSILTNEPPPQLERGLDNIASNLKDLIACSHRRAYQVLEDILRDIKNSSTAHYVAYPLIFERPGKFIRKYSFCKKKSDGCWKIGWSSEDLMRLPHSRQSQSSPLPQFKPYFMVTTDKSPYCARSAHMKMKLCPVQSSSMFGHEDVLISYSAFGENIPVYQGQIFGNQEIHFWLEISCGSLAGENEILAMLSVSSASFPQSVSNKSSIISKSICLSTIVLTDLHRNGVKFIRLMPKRITPETVVEFNSCFQTIF